MSLSNEMGGGLQSNFSSFVCLDGWLRGFPLSTIADGLVAVNSNWWHCITKRVLVCLYVAHRNSGMWELSNSAARLYLMMKLLRRNRSWSRLTIHATLYHVFITLGSPCEVLVSRIVQSSFDNLQEEDPQRPSWTFSNPMQADFVNCSWVVMLLLK